MTRVVGWYVRIGIMQCHVVLVSSLVYLNLSRLRGDRLWQSQRQAQIIQHSSERIELQI